MFAYLGFAADAEDSAFDPDYIEPLELVVKKFAAAFVRKGFGNQMIAEAGLASQPSRFPSWIPDWTNANKRLQSFTTEDPEGDVYDAASGTMLDLAVMDNNSVLKVWGGFFDSCQSGTIAP